MSETVVADLNSALEAAATSDGKIPLELKIERHRVGPCRQHVAITVARNSVDQVIKDTVNRLIGRMEVPGFRVGHVPESLVRRRFKKELNDEVKQRIVVQAMEQLAEQESVDPINQPDIDLEVLEIPDAGDFIFEFDVETRPEFDLPEYKGISIQRPTREISEADVDVFESQFLERYGKLVPVTDAAKPGDTLSASIEFFHKGKSLSRVDDIELRMRKTLHLQDGDIANFAELMAGAKEGDTRTTTTSVSIESHDLALRGETIDVSITVLDVKHLEVPTIDETFALSVGMESRDELREEFRETLKRQIDYAQRRACRKQVLDKITASADWDLPEDMVTKQIENALHREILEMRQAGFSEEHVRSQENELRQKSISMTRQNLKEHFILDRIAEAEGIHPSESELDREIALIARQNGETARKVRARMQKTGVIENLRAQMRERMAVDFILDHAEFTNVELPSPVTDAAAISVSICPPKAIDPKSIRKPLED